MLGNFFPPPMHKKRIKALCREKSNFYQCIHILRDYNRVKLRKKELFVKNTCNFSIDYGDQF